MNIKVLTFEAYHGRNEIGSTRIRIHNMVKKWPELQLYKYGDKPDVMLFQKVYMTYDYRLHEHLDCPTILDVCDPDWLNNVDVRIKETFDAVTAIVCPTETFAKYIHTMTNTPVRVIKDRFDMDEFPKPKQHTKKAETVIWFGYAHNAETLRFAVPSIERRGLKLLIVSNQDPQMFRAAQFSTAYQKKYSWIKYTHPQAYKAIQQGDIVIFPKGTRPEDRFKSENKTVIAELLGLPVAKDAEELDSFLDPQARNQHIEQVYGKLRKDYDVNESVNEYRKLIDEITS